MRLAVTWLLAGIFSAMANSSYGCTYLGPTEADAVKPESWFKTSKGLYIGSIQTIERIDNEFVVGVVVTHTLKGPDQPLVRAKRNVGVVMMCLPLPRIGSSVLVALDSILGDQVLPVTEEYTKNLQEERARVQSNSTVERDARKSSARPSP